MVSGSVSRDGLIGPFFFDDTITGESYLQLFADTVYSLLSMQPNINDLWSQQDGALPH